MGLTLKPNDERYATFLRLTMEGATNAVMAEALSISVRTLQKWKAKLRSNGTLVRKRGSGRKTKVSDRTKVAIRRSVRSDSNMSLVRRKATLGVNISVSTLRREIKKLDA